MCGLRNHTVVLSSRQMTDHSLMVGQDSLTLTKELPVSASSRPRWCNLGYVIRVLTCNVHTFDIPARDNFQLQSGFIGDETNEAGVLQRQ